MTRFLFAKYINFTKPFIVIFVLHKLLCNINNTFSNTVETMAYNLYGLPILDRDNTYTAFLS